ncbi:FAD-dependent oxidoreductase [Paenibacillus thalictri]|uniref:FAD-dependent oxidoreductase n=1 Tax=Paenibacillus thalictri TaxID=2527873 RepID=A0A4Q9DTN9_9BACL|nr:FAD-dependent oxidoreductase [Paenibacillus thalictri]TBL78567.1 FAD-dependent oxidoreductase [Paenibacillus thalictri]
MDSQVLQYTAEIRMVDEYDIVVFGGGPTGCTAAIQAGREGARVALVEKNGMLGGTTTVASVNFPGLFHTRLGRQIIRGIGWEMIEETEARGGARLQDFSIPYEPKQHPKHHIWLNRFIYATVLDDFCLAAGVQLRLHEMPVDIRIDKESGKHIVVLAGKSGLSAVRAGKLIDATGDANVAGMMGYATEQEEHVQPGTLIYHMTGYELGQVDKAELRRLAGEALAAGTLLGTDFCNPREEPPFWRELEGAGGNRNHIAGIDGSTSEGKTQAELKGRAALLRAYKFLRTVPGCENLEIDYVASECGIRETKRVVGERRISGLQYKTGFRWPDAVCYSYYPIDIHQHDNNSIDIRPLEDGIVASVPYGALIPQGSDHLLTAGRCISGDSEAHSAYRVQASSMATGQAAGAAAALAVRQGISVREVDIGELREMLVKHGAIVPD